jgi:UDP-2,4-diacetamido-2,4,6-trideoxy-beta-L-altropyranose hydrolase
VLLIADGGEQAGLGHISRSSALAVALRCRRYEVECRLYGGGQPIERDGVAWIPLQDISESGDANVLVLDSYRVPASAVQSVAGATPLVVMHDHGDLPLTPALLVSTARPWSDEPPRLAGPAYACLRAPFWGIAPRRIDHNVRSVLVVTGAGGGNLGSELAFALGDALPEAKVTLVRGPYAPAVPADVSALEGADLLLEPLLAADLVVTGAGQTLLEAAATGAPSVALPLVDNQRRQARALADEKAVCLVDPPTVSAAVAAARGLADDLEARCRLARHAQETVDGFGALRVAYHVAVLAQRARS